MKNKKQSIALVFLFAISILLLTWCQQEKNQNNNFQDDVVIDETVSKINQQLVIYPGCIGCGKCFRHASQNFAMEWGQAVVVSQENIDSVEVSMAISWCPVSVIEIIEA